MELRKSEGWVKWQGQSLKVWGHPSASRVTFNKLRTWCLCRSMRELAGCENLQFDTSWLVQKMGALSKKKNPIEPNAPESNRSAVRCCQDWVLLWFGLSWVIGVDECSAIQQIFYDCCYVDGKRRSLPLLRMCISTTNWFKLVNNLIFLTVCILCDCSWLLLKYKVLVSTARYFKFTHKCSSFGFCPFRNYKASWWGEARFNLF